MNKLLITLCASLLTLNTYAGLCESREASTERERAAAQQNLEKQMLTQASIEINKLKSLAQDHQNKLDNMLISPIETMDKLVEQKKELLASLRTLNTYQNCTFFQPTIKKTVEGWLTSENATLLAYRFLSPDPVIKKKIDDTLETNYKTYEEEIKDLLALSTNK